MINLNKGIIADGISRMRKQVDIDGKLFSRSNDFKFDRITFDINIVCIDDIYH